MFPLEKITHCYCVYEIQLILFFKWKGLGMQKHFFNSSGKFHSSTVVKFRFPFHLPLLGMCSMSKTDEHLKNPGCAATKAITDDDAAPKPATVVATSVLEMLTCD